jgi:hypothetical protein
MKMNGRLACEACGFDFAIIYGERGSGFIECHHTKPVATLAEGHKTHIDDLALVCANCHRIIHRDRKWPSIAELKALLAEANSRLLRHRMKQKKQIESARKLRSGYSITGVSGEYFAAAELSRRGWIAVLTLSLCPIW